MPRLEHLGFPAEPRLELYRVCEDILTIDRWPRLPCAQHLSPQDVAEDIAINHLVEDTEEPQIVSSTAPAPTALDGPSTSVAPPQHISISTRDFLAIMDAVHTFSSTSASFTAAHTALAKRMARTEAVVAQIHAILMQLQCHLGLPPIPPSVPTQAFSTAATNFPPAPLPRMRMRMTFHLLHTTEEVSLPYLTFQSEPHCGQCDIWLGGELAREVAFTFMLLLLF